jgi:hypothetical protein
MAPVVVMPLPPEPLFPAVALTPDVSTTAPLPALVPEVLPAGPVAVPQLTPDRYKVDRERQVAPPKTKRRFIATAHPFATETLTREGYGAIADRFAFRATQHHA